MQEELKDLQASSHAPRKTIVLPNNVRINPDDVRIRYDQLTIGRSLGHGRYYMTHLKICII